MQKRITLPPVEAIARLVHEGWRERRRIEGVTSRRSSRNEELMVPYGHLSEHAKEENRQMVRDVYAAIDLASDEINLAS